MAADVSNSPRRKAIKRRQLARRQLAQRRLKSITLGDMAIVFRMLYGQPTYGSRTVQTADGQQRYEHTWRYGG